jgi:hypothetical protein
VGIILAVIGAVLALFILYILWATTKTRSGGNGR